MVRIIETLIPANTNARPGTRRRGFKGMTIHETGNYKAGAGAKNHSVYKTVNGGWNAEESYHYVVDDTEGFRLLPEDEIGWHAGDGFSGTGNNETIAIEICVNSDSNFTNAMKNAAWICADVLRRNGITNANGWINQHNKWSGKNCPQQIRENGRWGEFMGYVQSALNGTSITNPPTTNPSTDVVYRVRKSYNEASTQIGAYSVLNNAIECAKSNSGYSVFDSNGNVVYPVGSTPAPGNVQYVNLYAVRDTWAVYPLGVARNPANVKGYLTPKDLGGLTYTIIESLGSSAYVINTNSYGKVQIYCPNDSEGNTSSSARYELCDPGASSSQPTPPSGGSDSINREISRKFENGNCLIVDGPIRFRSSPEVNKDNFTGTYFNTESVNYDTVIITEGYVWISWCSRSNIRRYMPITDRSTGEQWTVCR